MAESDVRVCPHCGAMVSGDTEHCPSCDEPLSVNIKPVSEQPDIEKPKIDDAQVLAVMRGPDDETFMGDQAPPPKPTETVPPESLAEAAATQDAAARSQQDTSENMAQQADDSEEDRTITAEFDDPDDGNLPYQSAVGDTPAQNPTPAENPLPFDPGTPFETHEASHSPIAGSSPVQPAARVPDPDPLPPMLEDDAEEDQSSDDDDQSTSRQVPSTQRVVIPSAPFTPPPETQPMQPVQQQPQNPVYGNTPALPYSQQVGNVPQQPTPYQGAPYGNQPYQQQPMQYQPGYAQQQYPQQQHVPSDYWLNQRVQAYQNANYKLEGRNQYEALLTTGKKLPFLWWVVAGASVFGAAWYFLILLTSGFGRDKVYIGLEPDGYVFEEGTGSAHIRRRRARGSRRWAIAGIVIAVLSIIFLVLLGIVGVIMMDQYEAELNAAFPEFTLFRDFGDDAALNQNDISTAETLAYVIIVFSSVSILGVVTGIILAIISYIQAAAYRVNVAPLPGYD